MNKHTIFIEYIKMLHSKGTKKMLVSYSPDCFFEIDIKKIDKIDNWSKFNTVLLEELIDNDILWL